MRPEGRLVGAPEVFENGGASSEQRRAPFERAVGIEFRDLELAERELQVTLVETGTGHRDRERHADGGVER